MKMSPRQSQGVVQAGVAVIKRNAPVQSLVDVDFGSRKAETLALLRDLEALTFPLHDVVVADHALMDKTTDAVQVPVRPTSFVVRQILGLFLVVPPEPTWSLFS